MRIAIVGSGISGLSAAYWLNEHHDITLFEASDRLGGHTATKTVVVDDKPYDIDTGFIVFNDWTYPLFIELMDQLGVPSQKTEMGFSAFKTDGSYEYAGTNLNTLFSQRRTLYSPSHIKMLLDIMRFNKRAVSDWRSGKLEEGLSLGAYLKHNRYSSSFIDHYLVPMGSAIWSASTRDMMDFPLKFFVEFFYNHGLLSVNHRPQWRVIQGGSKQYIKPLIDSFADKIQLSEAVKAVRRVEQGVSVTTTKSEYEFDTVVFACHSDQALSALKDASVQEKQVLSAMRYRKNEVVLHTDIDLLPSKRRTWSSWNYCLSDDKDQLPVLTYDMNILQGIESDTTFCVTLNATDKIKPNLILGEYQYAHPIFDLPAIAAQKKWASINGGQTFFCGAYWFNGFHEDGVRSAKRVVDAINA